MACKIYINMLIYVTNIYKIYQICQFSLHKNLYIISGRYKTKDISRRMTIDDVEKIIKDFLTPKKKGLMTILLNLFPMAHPKRKLKI